jgi:hypothetical protein
MDPIVIRYGEIGKVTPYLMTLILPRAKYLLPALPIISVPPVRRPKLDSSHKKYSFKAEKELMKEKIRTALRIAVHYEHPDICVGAFGCGPLFRNPTREVATMFKDILFFEKEFEGHFSNVVFAFDESNAGSPASSSSSSSGSSSSHKSDLQIFKDIFDPKKICDETYQK